MTNNKMKKISVALLAATMTISMCACGSKAADNKTADTEDTSGIVDEATPAEPVFSSTDDVTLEKIIDAITPSKLNERHPIFSYTYTVENSGYTELDGATVLNTHAKNNDIYEYTYSVTYSDGQTQNVYFSTDSNDQKVYLEYNGDYQVSDLSQDDLDSTIYGPIISISEENAKITSITEKDGKYIVSLEVDDEGDESSTIDVTIHPQSGNVTDMVYKYPSNNSDGDTVVTITFNYDDLQTIVRAAKDGNPDLDSASNSDGGSSDSSSSGSSLSGSSMLINTTDINGNPFTMDDIKNAKVIMVNLWEPWCGPCVGEMPDIQKLYDKYKDQGLLVLGVYSTLDMQEDAEAIVSENGIQYPILKCDDNLAKFEQDYVPATFFIDNNGNLLSDEPVAGSQSFEDWESIVQGYLK